jgi:hypothetical protein
MMIIGSIAGKEPLSSRGPGAVQDKQTGKLETVADRHTLRSLAMLGDYLVVAGADCLVISLTPSPYEENRSGLREKSESSR